MVRKWITLLLSTGVLLGSTAAIAQQPSDPETKQQAADFKKAAKTEQDKNSGDKDRKPSGKHKKAKQEKPGK